MKHNYSFKYFILLLLLIPLSGYAVTLTSVQSGDWTDPATWGSVQAPKPNDDVVISSGHIVTLDGLGVNHKIKNVTIEANGTLRHGSLGSILIRGSYTNNGIHDGFGEVELKGLFTPVISGTGTIDNAANLYISNIFSIASGTDISKTAGNVVIDGAFTVTNNGVFTIAGSLIGNDAAATWINSTNSILNIGGDLLVTGVLDATTVNVVNYNGAADQNIKTTTYFNLTISGGGNKNLQGNLNVLNNLTLDGGTLVHNTYDIDLSGDWLNTGGTHDGSSGRVVMQAPNNQLISHASTETFYKLFISGSGVKSLNANILVNDSMVINSGLDVTAGNYTIEIGGDWEVPGTFYPQDGTIKLTGSTTQNINSVDTISFYNLVIDNAAGAILNTGVYELRGTLTLTNGTFNTNNQLTLISDANGTARIAEITGGSIVGDITMQRFLPSGATGWKNLTSAVSGQTLADWNDDFYMSGFSGSDDPGYWFVSVYTYDETVLGMRDYGYVGASDISDPINLGEGYWAYVGPVPLTIDVTGPPNTGNINLPVSYTNDPNEPASEDGWNMVGNPYPSSIDWDLVWPSSTNINNFIYTWDADAQNYRGWSAGISINGGSPHIPSTQAFWVQANAASPALPIQESMKSSVDEEFKTNKSIDDFLRFTVEANGYSDQTVFRFRQGSAFGYETDYDGRKMYSNNANVPGVATVSSDSFDLAWNAMPELVTDVSVPVKVIIGNTSSAVLTFEGVDKINASCVLLEDKFTGQWTDLKTDSAYSFTIEDSTTVARFSLHFYARPDVEESNVTCNGISNGKAVAEAIGAANADYVWKDISSNVLQTSTGSSSDTLYNLTSGDYYVEIIDSSSACPVRTDTFTITEPSAISINETRKDVTCYGDADGNASLNATGGTSPYSYNWSTGDNTAGISNLIAGNYSATITDDNGCNKHYTTTITEPVEIIASFTSSDDTAMLSVNGAEFTFTNNTNGATDYLWEFGDGNISIDKNPTHSYFNEGTYLVNLTASNGPCEQMDNKTVTVDQPTFVNEVNSGDAIKIRSAERKIYVDLKLKQSTEIRIILSDLIGRKVLNRNNISIKEGTIMLDAASLPDGIYLLGIEGKGLSKTEKLLLH